MKYSFGIDPLPIGTVRRLSRIGEIGADRTVKPDEPLSPDIRLERHNPTKLPRPD